MKSILVTTEHQGVFYGEVPEDTDLTQRTLSLTNARMAIIFGTTGGVAELAYTGPTSKTKVGSPADIPVLHDVTAVWLVTDEAREKWTTA